MLIYSTQIMGCFRQTCLQNHQLPANQVHGSRVLCRSAQKAHLKMTKRPNSRHAPNKKERADSSKRAVLLPGCILPQPIMLFMPMRCWTKPSWRSKALLTSSIWTTYALPANLHWRRSTKVILNFVKHHSLIFF